jgi:phospholipase A1/A2
MRSLLLQFTLFIMLFFFVPATAQVQALFNSKVQPRSMTERWELDSTATRGTFLLTPYKPIYLLPVSWSSNPNEAPFSGNGDPDFIVPGGTNFDNIEAKFQLSFKTKIFQDVFWGHGDLWIAYTQISHWQLYNKSLSRPFREINYEPEIILNFPVKFHILGFDTRMVGVAFNHVSNGKSNPFSRSWNRIVFHVGFDRENWSVYFRPWLRMRATKDDNPDIAQFIGRGDLNVIYVVNGSVFSLIVNHNLNFNAKTKGNASLSWSYPVKGNFKGCLQLSHGYGDSLIDYNYSQTTIGLGISLLEWL